MRRIHEGLLAGLVLGWSALLACIAGCGGESATGGSAAAPSAAAAAPSAAPAPAVCATFYADANLKGATLVSMGPTDDSPTVPAAFNDVMSSVAIAPGCTVMAYADANYGGAEVTFTQTAGTIPAAMNDNMSSYKCACGGGGAK
jgi:Peptidase inhibitor family I36